MDERWDTKYTWGRNMRHSIYNLGPTVSFKLNPISSYDIRETKRHRLMPHIARVTISH